MRAGVPHCNTRGRPANIVHCMGISIARADLRQFSRECSDGWRGRHKPPRQARRSYAARASGAHLAFGRASHSRVLSSLPGNSAFSAFIFSITS